MKKGQALNNVIWGPVWQITSDDGLIKYGIIIPASFNPVQVRHEPSGTRFQPYAGMTFNARELREIAEIVEAEHNQYLTLTKV